MEKPEVGRDVGELARLGIPVDAVHISFFIGHNNVVRGDNPPLPERQRKLFLMLSRLAASFSDFLGLPAGRTIELGSRIEV